MNSSQSAGSAALVAIFAYPALLWAVDAYRRWKDRRILRKIVRHR